ncbi:MAG: type II toxin-antitoxin system RelE/ParE family toxin [Candidatus Marithrix sp.]|nr:type II toxin-antitoxin system RelE/ParE family toxin [Candidatus Marithrix sp.]
MTNVNILQMPLFKRTYKKLKPNQQEAVDKAVIAIVENPLLGKKKRGDLNEIYVYKFDCVNRQLLIAYEWNYETRVLIALGIHENFYRNLKRNIP